MVRHYLRVDDLSADEFREVLDEAASLKVERHAALAAGYPVLRDELGGRTVGLVFEKPSLRTRVSFDVGVHELGGHPLTLHDFEIGLGKRESIADTAQVLSRYVQCIVLRTFGQDKLEELAANATVPVVNSLSDLEHPCQAVADLQTVAEAHGQLSGVTMAYVGDGNNVANSLLLAGSLTGMHVRIVHPSGYAPDHATFERATQHAAETGGSVALVTDPVEGVKGADVVYTDVWASMGQEDEAAQRAQAFDGFQVTGDLMSHAADGAIFLHCLPAHRGEEVAAEVVDGPASRVFDQAENRLHAQKSLLRFLMVTSA